jgi:hypothetical protein
MHEQRSFCTAHAVPVPCGTALEQDWLFLRRGHNIPQRTGRDPVVLPMPSEINIIMTTLLSKKKVREDIIQNSLPNPNPNSTPNLPPKPQTSKSRCVYLSLTARDLPKLVSINPLWKTTGSNQSVTQPTGNGRKDHRPPANTTSYSTFALTGRVMR